MRRSQLSGMVVFYRTTTLPTFLIEHYLHRLCLPCICVGLWLIISALSSLSTTLSISSSTAMFQFPLANISANIFGPLYMSSSQLTGPLLVRAVESATISTIWRASHSNRGYVCRRWTSCIRGSMARIPGCKLVSYDRRSLGEFA